MENKGKISIKKQKSSQEANSEKDNNYTFPEYEGKFEILSELGRGDFNKEATELCTRQNP